MEIRTSIKPVDSRAPIEVLKRSSMKNHTIFVMLLALAASKRSKKIVPLVEYHAKTEGRIIGGEKASIGQFPWQAALMTTKLGGSYICGGALIDRNWILTAAHCADGTFNYKIYLGGLTLNKTEEGRVETSALTAFVHPKYNRSTLNNDIALVRLAETVELNSRIQTVQLPTSSYVLGDSQGVTVSGWGKISDNSSVSHQLNFVELSTITNQECAKAYGPEIILQSTLCCRGGQPEQSTCSGDSGGPLVAYNGGKAVHVGVVSFVNVAGCSSGNPSGYVRTESFLDWITQITGITTDF